MKAPVTTVPVSASLSMTICREVSKRARAERKTVTALLRPFVLDAIASGEVREAVEAEISHSMPIAMRLPVAARAALGELAAQKGFTVSRILAAMIIDSMKRPEAVHDRSADDASSAA